MEIITASPDAAHSQPVSASKRRLSGLVSGLMAGIVYGAVSGYVNHILLAGVPYFQPPFGSFGNLLAATFIGGMTGLATSSPERRSAGVLAGVIVAAALAGLRLTAQTWFFSSQPGDLSGFWLIFLVLCVIFSPLVLVLRLGVEAQARYSDQMIFAWERVRWPVALGLVSLIAGIFAVYSANEFNALTHTDALIKQGLAAGLPSELPQALSDEWVPDFWEHRNESYQLLLLPRDLTAEEGETVVAVGFDSGWNMVCTFAEDQSLRNCEEPQAAFTR